MTVSLPQLKLQFYWNLMVPNRPEGTVTLEPVTLYHAETRPAFTSP